MSKAKRWKRTEDKSSKVISALATKVTELEKQLASGGAAHATSGSGGGSGGGNKKKPKLMIPEWRTVKKGASVEKDGKTWHWCPHHFKEGLFDDLYMPHKPEDHDEWAQKKKENAEKRKKNMSGN